jgi:23S rRNA pseudouridine2604 synthase
MEEAQSTRINKYLSEVGYCSRRAADKLIEQGKVTINGTVPEMGTKIVPGDEVRVNGELITEPKEKQVYIAFNKPIGIVCTTDTGVEKDNIIDYIGYPKRIFPIVTVNKPVTRDFVQKMSAGIPILDTVTRKCHVEEIGRNVFKIVLTQGLNRQIRRMCEYLGYRVVKLKRVRIMNISLDMPVGKWRYLTTQELNGINELVAASSKTHHD